jgi:hypothetical protein
VCGQLHAPAVLPPRTHRMGGWVGPGQREEVEILGSTWSRSPSPQLSRLYAVTIPTVLSVSYNRLKWLTMILNYSLIKLLHSVSQCES